MDEADRHGTEAAGGDPSGNLLQGGFVERLQLLSLGADPAFDREAVLAWDERRRQLQVEIILLEAVLRAHLDHVAEPLGRDQRGLGAAALDQRVGGKRRSVDHHADIGQTDTGIARHDLDAVEYALLGRRVDRQHLR